jgi:hypothetical protein
MDTVERTSLPKTTVYDGFISYSHAADGLLAPRLQSALQRFAKPWWKRRAVRVFRDESSLSANPHLWSSITEALDQAAWFVLLLSPDAAESQWVNQEIEYWATHNDPSRILPVLTDGHFGWDGADVAGDAAPDALQGVFTEEPRWVDLRFARDEDQLDLKNPRFSSAVADIASALRGVPKDELESEEVRQHRRTIRTAWAAAALVGLLGVAATLFAIQSAANAREAETQRLAAETEADRANEEAGRADANAQEAEAQRRLADQRAAEARQREEEAIAQTEIAESRRLVMAATLAIETDPELAMLLALEAQRTTDSTALEASAPMREAVKAHSLLWRFPVPTGRVNSAALSPEAATVYYTTAEENVLRAVDVGSNEILWEYSESTSPSTFREVGVSPDGLLIALSVVGDPERPARVLFFEPHSSTPESPVKVLESEGCATMSTAPGGFSEQGRYFTVKTGTTECGSANPEADWAVAYDTSNWEEVFVYSADDFTSESIQIVESASRAILSRGNAQRAEGGFQIVEIPGWNLIADFERKGYAAASPSGAVVFDSNLDSGCACTPSKLQVIDSDLNTAGFLAPEIQPNEEEGSILVSDPVSFSPDGSLIVTITQNQDWIFNASDGSTFKRIPSNQHTLGHSWSSDSTKLLTAHEDVLLLWAVRPDAGRLGRIGVSTDTTSLALELLTRGFTPGECQTHSIDPCPTLEEMRDG